ncbi:MAG: rhomboid family intramembrane serine protease [Rhodobacterales bacterium 32-66-7]|nr:MAG: rhomboid family intramembrane serine protease [Rhodobacterales bacterium 12-65-15]OYX24863.1 MAG: rhomboid family intramembrane serine protease [Rhodobacterales bacterium 32-66-7]
MDHDRNAPPLNPLPVIVWVLALPLIAVELLVSLAEAGLVGGASGIGWRLQAVERFAMFPSVLRQQVEAGGHPYVDLLRLVSYPLVHGSVTHAVFALVILLALGKMVGENFRWWGVVVVVLAATVAGALVYGLAIPAQRVPLIGAYPPVYGLIGAFTYLMWTNPGLVGGNKYRAFSMIGVLLTLQLVFGVVFGADWTWVAEVTGFLAGFLTSFIASPGGFRQLLALIRQR